VCNRVALWSGSLLLLLVLDWTLAELVEARKHLPTLVIYTEASGGHSQLTVRDHVRVGDHVVEEGQHVNHLLLPLSKDLLAHAEGLRDVALEELKVDCVDDLQK